MPDGMSFEPANASGNPNRKQRIGCHGLSAVRLCLAVCLGLCATVAKGMGGFLLRPPQGEGRITLEVVDSRGRPVAGASGRMAFLRSDARGDYDVSRGTTDEDGRIVFTGRTYGEAVFHVGKEDFYVTRGRYWFQRPPTVPPEVERRPHSGFKEIDIYPSQAKGEIGGGRWLPWNPLVQVTLKEKRRPVPLAFSFNMRCARPEHGEPVGFDLEVGDWVAPCGKGEHADIVLGYQTVPESADPSGGEKDGGKRFVFSAPGISNGFVRMKRDAWSGLSSDYEAPEDGYEPALAVPAGSGPVWPEDEYLFCRTRTVLDPQGRIVHANYSKLYRMGRSGNGDVFILNTGPVWFNPADCDRNLEYDPDRNLNPNGFSHYEFQ
jgi:hypothetical protein